MHKNEVPQKGEIIIYKTADKQIQLEVRLEKETVWLTQKQIDRLYPKVGNNVIL